MQAALMKATTYEEQLRARKAFADYAALEKSGRSTAADKVAQEVYRQVLRGRTMCGSVRSAAATPRPQPGSKCSTRPRPPPVAAHKQRPPPVAAMATNKSRGDVRRGRKPGEFPQGGSMFHAPINPIDLGQELPAVPSRGSSIGEVAEDALAITVTVGILAATWAWFVVLPTIGLLYVVGWLT
jgi:hypothetical protein